MKMTITNNSRALQGVHSTAGLVFIEAGQSKEIDVADSYVERVKALPFLGIEGVGRDLSKAPNLPPPANGVAKVKATVPSDLSALRKDYKDAFGKGPSPKWDADTLRAKLAEKAAVAEPKFEDMTDTELKTFLGAKGVTTTDETRDQLIELAKAA